jgi:hypothetical protein
MKNRILATGIAVALAATALIALGTQQAGATQEFVVIARQTNFELFPASGPPTTEPMAPPTIGDRFIIREDLLQGAVTVGYDNVICTVTFNDDLLCDALFSFTGKGDIHASALLRGGAGENSPSMFDASIDGGTLAYRSARGSIHVTNINDTDSRNAFLIT